MWGVFRTIDESLEEIIKDSYKESQAKNELVMN